MTSDVQVGWIFPLLDDLMMSSRLADGVLLRFNALAECAVFALEFRPHALDRFLNSTELRVSRLQFLLRALTGIGAAETGPNELSAFIGQARPARAQGRCLCVAVCRRWVGCFERADLFQERVICFFVLLDPAIHRAKFAIADVR